MAIAPQMPRLAESYDQKLSDQEYAAKYGNTPEALQARVAALFSNRGLSADPTRISSLAAEVAKGRTLDSIRSGLDPYAKKAAPGSVKTLDLAEIRQALAAISGSFKLQRGEYQGNMRSAKSGAKRALEALKRSNKESVRSFQSGAAGAGLLRSGLALKDVGNINQSFAEGRSEVISNRDNTLRTLQGNLSTLKAQETAARATKARELARTQVGTQEAIARALKLV
jgi:hypothetical protein